MDPVLRTGTTNMDKTLKQATDSNCDENREGYGKIFKLSQIASLLRNKVAITVDGTYAAYPVRITTYFHISREIMQTPHMSATGRGCVKKPGFLNITLQPHCSRLVPSYFLIFADS